MIKDNLIKDRQFRYQNGELKDFLNFIIKENGENSHQVASYDHYDILQSCVSRDYASTFEGLKPSKLIENSDFLNRLLDSSIYEVDQGNENVYNLVSGSVFYCGNCNGERTEETEIYDIYTNNVKLEFLSEDKVRISVKDGQCVLPAVLAGTASDYLLAEFSFITQLISVTLQLISLKTNII